MLTPSQEIFRSLHEETLLLTRVVESLFALADADAAVRSLELKQTDLASVVARAIGLCRPQIEASGVVVETRIAPGIERVMADADRLVQVTRNLLQNSLEHTPAGGHIWIVITGLANEIQMAVEDDGEGFPPADLPLVFDRFFRGRRGASDDPKRLGVGLAIVKELITAHGGRAEAESRDNGALVWFSLPRRTN